MVEPPRFVDVHSHVCPSGDDGAQSVQQGRALCRSAARHGTRILFATPHVWVDFPLDPERERRIHAARDAIVATVEIDLRLGYELQPCDWLLEDDLWRYELEGTGAILLEMPFGGAPDLFFAVGERADEQGLRVIAAHPERSRCVIADPTLATEIAGRGWLVQVNEGSLTGWEGPEVEALAWSLIADEVADLVASDGHRLLPSEVRPARKPHLDEAYRRARRRFGSRIEHLFDGSAVGLCREPEQTALAARR